MNTKISALMDGEINGSDLRDVCAALRQDDDLRRRASVYALIGDALRREPYLTTNISAAVLRRLSDEPVVLAPQRWQAATQAVRRIERPTMALAAGIAGLTVVAWLGLTSSQMQQSPAQVAQKEPLEMASADADIVMQEYLIAHQVQSGSVFLNGDAQHIRAVSLTGAGSRQ